MNEQLHALVERTLAKGVGARVFPLRWDNRRIWVKQSVRAKHKVWHRVQRFAANITGIPLLRPTVSPGGQAGLESEAATLRKLAQVGVLVPDLIDVADHWIAIGDNGRILKNCIEDDVLKGDDNAVRAYVVDAGKALARLHGEGVAHGAPLLRNMTLRDDGQIGFIDFEEDPNARMPIADAQARDVLLFVFSIQREFKNARNCCGPVGKHMFRPLAKPHRNWCRCVRWSVFCGRFTCCCVRSAVGWARMH